MYWVTGCVRLERRRGMRGRDATRIRRSTDTRQRDRRVVDVGPSVPRRVAAVARAPAAAAVRVCWRPGQQHTETWSADDGNLRDNVANSFVAALWRQPFRLAVSHTSANY